MAKRTYTDKFRASAVVMLEAQGYPDRKGSLTAVANHLSIPLSTLKGWYDATRNPPPTNMRNEKKGDLVAMLRSEVSSILERMEDVRDEATYQQLAVATGILLDKLQILEGKPTHIFEDVTNTDPKQKLISYLDSIAAREAERKGAERPN